VAEGRADEVLPLGMGAGEFGRTPVSAYRWLSLLERNGNDDYFSSDLGEEELARRFGAVRDVAVLVLMSGRDEHVPGEVDVGRLLGRWKEAVEKGGGRVDAENGGVVDGARHNLEGDDEAVVEELCRRVVRFLHNFVEEESPQL